ncbi:MAG: hypothetical protein JWM10_233, partial [Myxococcaceae bacterium]|nr:hypothetical protein [Myxococcaceae bacterium]
MTRALVRCVFAALALAATPPASAQNHPAPAA